MLDGKKTVIGGIAAIIGMNPAILALAYYVAMPAYRDAQINFLKSAPAQGAICGQDDCGAAFSTLTTAVTNLTDSLEAAVTPGPCIGNPASFEIENGAPDEWVKVRVTGVCRIRPGCGDVVPTYTVVNGGGLSHTLESEFDGAPIAYGDCRDFLFKVHLTEKLEPGLGRFLISMSYPDAEPWAPISTFGPEPFIIEGPTHDRDD